MKKSKKTSVNIGAISVFIICGALSALVAIVYLDGIFEEYGFFASMLMQLALFLLAYYIQLIIHEAGHLVAGLLSGYSFGSFRIGSLMIVKENGELKVKKQDVAGTGGQCLMTPPPIKDGKFPVVFYNLGGVMMNFLTLPLCILLLQCVIGKPALMAFSVLAFLSGLLIILTNGIPLKMGMINNDGANAVEVAKHAESRLFFYNQFIIIDEIRKGKRLRDMDAELFPMPSEQGMQNSISASGAVFFENRLMDEGRFDEALALADKLLKEKNAIVGLHKNLLMADKLTVLLMKGERLDEVERFYTAKEYQAFKKQMKTNISVIRTDYAYALLKLRDKKAAGDVLESFEKCAKTHPYATDIESERELLYKIDNRAEQD